MRVTPWAAELAREFWAEAGEPEPFARNLRESIAWALPLTIVTLPRLRLDDLRDWLHDNGMVATFDCDDRGLRRAMDAAVTRAEDEADRLAFELLAPAAEVTARAGERDLVGLLESTFGFPTAQAREYTTMLMPPAIEEPLLRRWR